MTKLIRYLLLPDEITAFEAAYLKRMNRIAYGFFALHVPVFTTIAALNGTGPLWAFALTLLMVVGPALASVTLPNPRHVSMTFGFTAMGLGGLLVHFGQGPMQIEMHFYFFVLIALLAVFANPLVILTAAATVTLHHLALWLMLPQSVFNYDASFWTVVVHAVFVVLESVAACFVARSFFDDVIGLERIVQARTTEIDARNRELRLVFDTVGQGFVTMERDGRMSAERSAMLGRWMGPAVVGERFVDYLARVDPSVAERFQLGWDAVLDDVLPLELNLEQMPHRVVCGGRHLRIDYTPILDGDALARVLVVLTDVTTDLERSVAEADQRDLFEVVDRIGRDKVGFLEFLAEGEVLLGALRRSSDAAASMRQLHTMKGNAALFGLSRVADRCHELEERLSESGTSLPSSAIDDLVALWGGVRQRLSGLLGEAVQSRVELDDAEYAEILRSALQGRPAAELAATIRGWKQEPTRRRLDRIAEQAQAVAQRLGKERLEVHVDATGVRLEPTEWAPFWSAFVHLVRNAVDHGIEAGPERLAVGKPLEGRITLRTAVDGDALTVSITDDGRGIDWAAIDRRARAIGLPTETEADLGRALLLDGVTTRDEVGAFSGRGVGMGAVATACHERGGEMSIRSVLGEGTTVAFRFPQVFDARRAA